MYAVRGEYQYQHLVSRTPSDPVGPGSHWQHTAIPPTVRSVLSVMAGRKPEVKLIFVESIFSQPDDGGDCYQINVVFPLHSELFINLLAASDR